jgi:hypothetical protein
MKALNFLVLHADRFPMRKVDICLAARMSLKMSTSGNRGRRTKEQNTENNGACELGCGI